MNKSILAGLLALGVVLCEKAKPNPFAGKKNIIKVGDVLCGFFDSMEPEGSALNITGLTFLKDQLPLIWSGGFVVKPAQRLGFTVDADGEVHENVWVEYMDPYSEQQETITIARMKCLVENQEEVPEQAAPIAPEFTTISILTNGQVVGLVHGFRVDLDSGINNLILDRVIFENDRVTKAFSKVYSNCMTESYSFQEQEFTIEVKRGNKVTSRLDNVWLHTFGIMTFTDGYLTMDGVKGRCHPSFGL